MHNLPSISCFSLLFFSFLFSFLFFPLWRFICFRVLLLPELFFVSSFFFLVSSSCSLLCFRSFMVDYSLAWSYRSVLLFLSPLVHRSVGIVQSILMSGEGEVRSNELETGLFSSKDRGILEVTSPSTSHKAWGIHCSLRRRTRKGLGIGSNSPLLLKLGSLMMMMIGSVVVMLTKSTSMRLTSLVDFVFLFFPSSRSFSFFCNLPRPS